LLGGRRSRLGTGTEKRQNTTMKRCKKIDSSRRIERAAESFRQIRNAKDHPKGKSKKMDVT